MLVEMSSPVFKENGVERPPVIFKEGLNVILGKEDGENSIGKSSAMLAIDFVFGGNTYISGDGVKHIGHHTLFFAFEFNGSRYYFARNTADADQIQVCDKNYELTGVVWTKEEFTDWLKINYGIDFLELSFRLSVSSFFRIYGKDNADELKPLRGIPGHSMEKSIDILIKLFNLYESIHRYKKELNDQKEKLTVFKNARRYRFVPDLVGGVEQYEANQMEIEDLKIELDSLTSQQAEQHSDEDIEKNRIKSQLKDDKLRLEIQIDGLKRRLTLLDMSIEYGLYPTEADLGALQEFFPGVNLRKIYEIENYHQKLAGILDRQFEDERSAVKDEIAGLEAEVGQIQERMNEIGIIGSISKEFLDKHSEIKGRMDALTAQNEAYLLQRDLEDQRRRASAQLKSGIKSILSDMERDINAQMKEYNDSLYTESRKPPQLTFNDYNSYRFETPDDTGTGSNYKGMVIYDLAILALTDLPAIAHDSFILKNIGDSVIDGIMSIYERSGKQIFIAFDKQDAYPQNTRSILANNTVLRLSDNGSELYGMSWNKEG